MVVVTVLEAAVLAMAVAVAAVVVAAAAVVVAFAGVSAIVVLKKIARFCRSLKRRNGRMDGHTNIGTYGWTDGRMADPLNQMQGRI